MAIPKGKNVKETPGVAGRNDRSPRAGILNGHAVPTIRLDLTELRTRRPGGAAGGLYARAAADVV